MKTQQIIFKQPGAWDELAQLDDNAPDWVLVFGAVRFFEHPDFFKVLKQRFGQAALTGCSTAGEVSGRGVDDETCTVTTVRFDTTRALAVDTRMADMSQAREAGHKLALQLPLEGLRQVLVFAPGVDINGSALVKGMQMHLGETVQISGGLAGDHGRFTRTWVLTPQGVGDDALVAVGLYGDALEVAHGCYGGWAPFGPSRLITRAQGNVLYELDGESALGIYKRYLGDYAKDLPASGLLFPFSMRHNHDDETGLTRTILGVNEAQGSLTLAGDVPQGTYLKLMHSSTDRLIEGAEFAAESARLDGNAHSLSILVSCVGRKLVMGDRVDEEVEAVSHLLGRHTTITGFYSNGEISPGRHGDSQLHNQTMTITSLREKA